MIIANLAIAIFSAVGPCRGQLDQMGESRHFITSRRLSSFYLKHFSGLESITPLRPILFYTVHTRPSGDTTRNFDIEDKN
ncbi:hypothetical protein BDW74DRAFT_35022 [Aspergillus multicolor]|uniref:uncharacterized protein n=1 Tax=Aspergillus multicolor TaxID=41759 RepID=UPI003CCD3ACD